tara:strand:+ start:3151 stop:3759 length:609 start_codon:yes stop_codon:yes gene_type:complete
MSDDYNPWENSQLDPFKDRFVDHETYLLDLNEGKEISIFGSGIIGRAAGLLAYLESFPNDDLEQNYKTFLLRSKRIPTASDLDHENLKKRYSLEDPPTNNMSDKELIEWYFGSSLECRTLDENLVNLRTFLARVAVTFADIITQSIGDPKKLETLIEDLGTELDDRHSSNERPNDTVEVLDSYLRLSDFANYLHDVVEKGAM